MKLIGRSSLAVVCSSVVLVSFAGCGGGGSSAPANTAGGSVNTEKLTLEICEQEYAGYDNAQWAQVTGYGPDRPKATACYQALVAGPLAGQDSQQYIDAYNNGAYDNMDDTQNTSNSAAQEPISSKTDLSYMKQHPEDKLSSGDCAAYRGGGETVSLTWQGDTLTTPIIKGQNSWSDVLSALRYDLAPADNMYKSIDACSWVQTTVEYGSMNYSEAVETIKRSTPNVFSD